MAQEKEKRHYLEAAVSSLVVIGIVKAIWPDLIPFGFWDAWRSPFGIWAGVVAGWPILAWGLFNGGKAFIVLDRDDTYRLPSAGETFLHGMKVSLWAGISEEIAFRWLIFLGAIPGTILGNYLFFGCAGFGFQEWFHNVLWGPLANWTTFGILENWLFTPNAWFVGASILTTNAFFREGHAYQGLLGLINSWFIGMGMFWLMFNYGLPAAIIVHVLYDALIFTGLALAVAKDR